MNYSYFLSPPLAPDKQDKYLLFNFKGQIREKLVIFNGLQSKISNWSKKSLSKLSLKHPYLYRKCFLVKLYEICDGREKVQPQKPQIFVAIKICGNFNNAERPKNNFIYKPVIRLSGRRIYITCVYTSRILISMRFTSVSLIICTQLFMQTNPVIVGSVLYRVAGQRGRMGKGGDIS